MKKNDTDKLISQMDFLNAKWKHPEVAEALRKYDRFDKKFLFEVYPMFFRILFKIINDEEKLDKHIWLKVYTISFMLRFIVDHSNIEEEKEKKQWISLGTRFSFILISEREKDTKQKDQIQAYQDFIVQENPLPFISDTFFRQTIIGLLVDLDKPKKEDKKTTIAFDSHRTLQ